MRRELIREVEYSMPEIEVGHIGQSASGSLWIRFWDDGEVETEFDIHTFGSGKSHAICPEDHEFQYHTAELRKVWAEISRLTSESFDHNKIVRQVESEIADGTRWKEWPL